MECRLLHGYDLDFSPNRWWWKFGTAFNLLLFPLGRLRISSLFAGADSEPLWQLLGWAFRELCELLLPHGLQPLSADNLGATFVQLLAVAVCPGVCPLLVVILVGLQGDNGVPDLVGFVLQLFRVHLVKGQGLDTDGRGDLHLLLDLLLRLGHLFASVHGGSRGLLA